MYQDLSTHHDRPVTEIIVALPLRIKGKSKSTCSNLSSPLGVHNMYLGAAFIIFNYCIKL